MRAGTPIDIGILVLIAVLYTAAQRWNLYKCPQMNRYNIVCAYNRMFCLKRDEVLTHGIAQMDLVKIMLCEISQTQKDKYDASPLKRDT